MNNTLVAKVRKFLAFLLIASIFAGLSYYIVYKVSFLPNGYKIVEVQNDTISLKSFNMLGIEKNITTADFPEKDTWKINVIESEVSSYKEYLWLLFTATALSISLFVYKIRSGMKLWKAILNSNIIFGVLLTLIPVIRSLNRIHDLIS
ncbi:hypothetical protein VBD025_15965 [Virgibacillus flavescens]|uniref:hypothetical protein n=1 Tax=Virgibacillus flavescens TaxID=1611422 RepID=UPI003D34214E